MGDLYLLKSGVFNLSTYLNELSKQLQKHFDNSGRYNYSVAQSSFDTWLDGYVLGAPGRKVSIYTEGCLLAFVADIMIRKATQNKFGIEEVMKRLYVDIAQQGKGYEQADYKRILEDVSGLCFDDYFENYINGTRPYDELVMNALNYLGLELVQKPSSLYSESKLGFKVLSKGKNFLVQAIHPQSPAASGGLSLGDEIFAVNDIRLNGDLNQWLQYFDSEQKSLTLSREGKMMKITLISSVNFYYFDYKILLSNLITGDQMNNLRYWGEEGIDF
jgi:predicted metalloprotease with PDZ domain